MNAQVEAALDRANHLRLDSVAIRKQMGALPYRESLLRAAELLDSPPESIQRTRIDRFLGSVKRMGPSVSRRLLADLQIPALRYVGPEANVRKGQRPLSDRQRWLVAAELRRRAS